MRTRPALDRARRYGGRPGRLLASLRRTVRRPCFSVWPGYFQNVKVGRRRRPPARERSAGSVGPVRPRSGTFVLVGGSCAV